MDIEFLVQPDVSLGEFLERRIEHSGVPNKIVVVSAFAALSTVFRIKPVMLSVRDAGGEARLVLGVDLGGTSREVLHEVHSWQIPVIIVKNRAARVTFHPKVYHLVWSNQADLIVGSNNLPEGRLFINYEAATRAHFNLPQDAELYERAIHELGRFLNPQGPTARTLDAEYLTILLQLHSIPSESEARRNRADAIPARPDQHQSDNVFGYEAPRFPPRLPDELQAALVAAARSRRLHTQRADTGAGLSARAPSPVVPLPQIDPAAFYITLPTLSGASGNIPGEVRILLAARDVAENFWGWRENYVRRESPRRGQNRVYHEWRSPWRIYSTDRPGDVQITPTVRLYFYDNSSDFRFYARRIQNLGGAAGDIVQIRRIDEPNATFECAVAKQGTPEWNEWISICVNRVRNSNRRFGFR